MLRSMPRLIPSALLAVLLTAAISFVASLASAQELSFRRADANTDGRVDISDPLFVLSALFLEGQAPTCADAADANDDGSVDISDAVFSLLHLFAGGAPPPAPGAECGADPTADDLDCASYAICEIVFGQSEFETPMGADAARGGLGAEDNAGGLDPGAPPPAADPQGDGGPQREIEEADLYRIVGDDLFVLNRYRGLYVIDIADLDSPEIVGHAPIFGHPLEMYVRGNTAYVLVSDYWAFWEEAGSPSVRGRYGSLLRIVDISDASDPRVVRDIPLAGYLSDSRIVGDVLYLVSKSYSWHYTDDGRRPENKTSVLSVRVGDPDDVSVIDLRDFPRDGWEHHIHATPDAIFLASSGYSSDRRRYETRLRYIDISDPDGAVQIRGEGVASGRVHDRWSVDRNGGVLRVASDDRGRTSRVHLTTFDVSDPDVIPQLGHTSIDLNESLTAARFDDDLGYLVTFRRIDPLFVFDLSNPRRPRMLGELEMTGWLDYIVPLGDRLVALGHEIVTTPEGWNRFELAVSLIDVADTTQPSLLSRVTLDGLRGWVPGDRDDFAKVFRVLPADELVLFPFYGWNDTDRRWVSGVQLIDLARSDLTQRGVIDGHGLMERGVPHEEDTVLALSTQEYQAADISDRDEPRTRGSLELARNVQGFSFLGDDHALQLAGDWYRGDTELVVTTDENPNAPRPVSRFEIPASYGRLFTNGDLAYVASVESIDDPDEPWRRATRVRVVDVEDRAAPQARGTVWLPEEVWCGYRSWYWGYGDQAVQVGGTTLAFHRYSFWWWMRGDVLGAEVDDGAIDDRRTQRIHLVDLADPDEPVVASTIRLEGVDWAWGLKARGDTLYLSTYRSEQRDGKWIARYRLRRYDVSDPAAPVELPDMSIPGMFIDTSPDGRTIYTWENRWDDATRRARSYLYALTMVDDRAHFRSRVEIDGTISSVQIDGDGAFASAYRWDELPLEGGGVTWRSYTSLVAVDLSDPMALEIAGEVELPYTWAYLQEVEDGRAFVGSGPGLFVFDVSDIDEPRFDRFFRTQGWVQDVLPRGDEVYLPSGYWGVQKLQLEE